MNTHSIPIYQRQFVPVCGIVAFLILLLTSLCATADVSNAIRSIEPYLVRIETIGGHEVVGRELANEGSSTGILLCRHGYIITGAFHFLHDPTSILLTFPDGSRSIATKIATDRLRMLTLLKANDFSERLIEPLPMRSTESIRIGERCIAVGIVFSAEPNVTFGIISGKDRIWGKAIQTDAAIGPNNYGGLLIDFEGRALGIPVPLSMTSRNVAAGAEMYDAGVGMAIPWEEVLALLPRLKEGNDLYPGTLGLGFRDNQTFVGEPVIAGVQPDSPAANAGLRAGDRIVKIDDIPMPTALSVTKNLRQRYADETLTITFLREGVEQNVSVKAVRY